MIAEYQYYFFSSKKKEMCNKLKCERKRECENTISHVFVNGEWIEFTEITTTEKPAGLWDDYVLVASGNDLKCKYE